jgi:uncharacterized protein YbaP (TraB family)
MTHDQYFKRMQEIDSKKKEIRELEGLSQEFRMMLSAFSTKISVLNDEIKQMINDQEGSVISLSICLNSQSHDNLIKILELTDDPLIISLIQGHLHG